MIPRGQGFPLACRESVEQALQDAGRLRSNEVDDFASDTVWLSSMARANALLIVPEEIRQASAGTFLSAIPLESAGGHVLGALVVLWQRPGDEEAHARGRKLTPEDALLTLTAKLPSVTAG